MSRGESSVWLGWAEDDGQTYVVPAAVVPHLKGSPVEWRLVEYVSATERDRFAAAGWDAVAAAAIMVGTLLDKHPELRGWVEECVERQHGSFPGAVHLQRASELIMREVDAPKSAIGERPGGFSS